MGPIVIGLLVMLLLALLVVPMLVVGGAALLFAGGSGSGSNCNTATQNQAQPPVSKEAANSIPADYLKWFQKAGLQFNVPWAVLAGIGKVESNDGRTTLPGVNSDSNAFGAAGPMQIGIGGASTNTWGGAAVHPASLMVAGVATDEDGNGTASVYDPADAIAGAAKYLVAHGAQQNIDSAIFAYNHASWYVEEVLSWASTYAQGGFTVANVNPGTGTTATGAGGQSCTEQSELAAFTAPNSIVSQAVSYAEEQLGKPYVWGATGPSAFDCSGLMVAAYESAGVVIPRTSQIQYADLPKVPADQVVAGDLVFFAGSDGTTAAPGHVGLVIGKNTMIEAYATGFPVRISTFGVKTSAPGDGAVVGFAQPWSNSAAGATPSATTSTTPPGSTPPAGSATPSSSASG
ncbi:MAG TPA: NlpC/P60 family protein [Trebonia sp.]